MGGVSVLCAALVLLFIGSLLRAAQGQWLAPGPFFCVYWAVGLGLPPLLAPEFFSSQTAVWYITLLVAAFGLGSLMAGGFRPPVRSLATKAPEVNLRLLRWLVVLGTACGLAAFVVIQKANGYSVKGILSAQGLIDAAASFSVDRYAGTTHIPVLVPPLLAFTYMASVVAPFAARGLRRGRTLACYLAPFTVASLYAMVTTERLGMLTVGFFLFAGWVAATAYWGGEVPGLRLRSLLAASTGFVALGGAFVAIAFLRVGSFAPSIQRVIWPKMVVYAVGYMPAFAQWLPHSPGRPRDWGTASFAGIVTAGSGKSKAFTESMPVGGISGHTNIFTAWRYLIEDFGFAGAPLAAFAIGCIATVAWKSVVERPAPGPLVAMLCAYSWMLNSITQTVFLFTNIVLAVVLALWALSRHPAAHPTSYRWHMTGTRRSQRGNLERLGVEAQSPTASWGPSTPTLEVGNARED